MVKKRVCGIDPPSGTTRPSKRHCASRHSQLDWRMNPEESYSDWTLVVRIEGTQEEIQRYNVHRAMLVTGTIYSKKLKIDFRNRERSTSNIGSTKVSLTHREDESVSILLDYKYGIHRPFKSVGRREFAALLSVADHLEVAGMHIVVEDILKSCKYNSHRGTKKFMQFFSVLQKREAKTGKKFGCFDLLVSEMTKRVLDGSFFRIDLNEHAPIAPRLYGNVVRKCVHAISRYTDASKDDYEFVLDFLSKILKEKKRTTPCCLPSGVLEKTFDDCFWKHLKSSVRGPFYASVALRLMNWEFQFGEAQDGEFSSFQSKCMKIITKAYRQEGSTSMNHFLFRLCDNDFDQYLEWCKYIPSGCLLQLMEGDLRSRRPRRAWSPVEWMDGPPARCSKRGGCYF